MTRKFNPIEEKIIKVLYKCNRPMTITELAYKGEIGWPTAKKYLQELEKDKIVKVLRSDKNVWFLNY